MVAPSPAYGTIRPARAPFGLVAPFALTVGLSAFLLFQVQLLLTKYLLPWFGGVAAVFTTCMLFFQVMLLAGYAYSHLLTRFRPRVQRWIHAALLLAATAWLGLLAWRWPSPITPGPSWKPSGTEAPVGHILLLLTASVGLPFFTLSTTGPLLQAWSARVFPGSSPYRWYALSNLGSLLGLISYPFLFEPLLTLRAQAWIWSVAYAVFAVTCVAVALQTLRAAPVELRPEAVPEPSERSGLVRRALWFLLPGCAVVTLLATTNQVCQEIASVPFLWVLPLTLYLLSFVVCFDHSRRYSRQVWTAVLAVATSAACFAFYIPITRASVLGQIAIFSAFALATCMVCHGEVFRLKPAAARLTGFYLTIAAGGAAGGVFVGIAAPRLFTGYWEMPLAVWLVWLLFFAVQIREQDSWVHAPPSWAPLAAFVVIAAGPLLAWYDELRAHVQVLMLFAVLAVVASLAQLLARSVARIRWAHFVPIALIGLGVVLLGYVELHSDAVARSRNFYGSLLVLHYDPDEHPDNAQLELRHGRITHGTQFMVATKRHMPTSYYGPESGLGVAILNHPKRREGYMRIGAVGLGTGTLAAYGRLGDSIRFYEINPEVLRLARTYFTYLKDTPAHLDVVLGDARLSMERELQHGEPQGFDILVLDAFNSDSIPVHLLTREAFAIYLQHLDAHGIIAVHVSNQTLDLEPLVRELAESFHLAACWIDDEREDDLANYSSSWVLVSPYPAAFDASAFIERAADFPERRVRLWTDDFSNLLSVIRR